MKLRQSYWIYSAALALAWAIVLVLIFTLRGPQIGQGALLVFAGFVIAWISGTIARWVYPPPARWTTAKRD
jgi:hypothetical protein